MKYAASTLAASVIALAAAFTPAAAQEEAPQRALVCRGALFNGEYTLKQFPTFAPLTPENFNAAAGENLVAEVGQRYDGELRIVPVDRTVPCDEFMQKIKAMPFVEWIQPDWLMQHQTNPQP